MYYNTKLFYCQIIAEARLWQASQIPFSSSAASFLQNSNAGPFQMQIQYQHPR